MVILLIKKKKKEEQKPKFRIITTVKHNSVDNELEFEDIRKQMGKCKIPTKKYCHKFQQSGR